VTNEMTRDPIKSEMRSPSESRLFNATLPLVGRILLSAIFLISGVGKLAAPAATVGYIASVGLPFPQLGLAIAATVEIVGGLALLTGYHARTAAMVLAVFCLATALSFHATFGDQNQFIHLLKNIAMAGGMLQVVAFGPGRFSLDAHRHRAAGAHE
jgi:putative oxidoreductase